MDWHVRTQPVPQPVGEQPADVVDVQVGKHDVGDGGRIDAGGIQSQGQLPGPRYIRELRPYPAVDEYGPAAATHHDHIQRPLEHVGRLEQVVQPGRQVGRVGIGAQCRGWKGNTPSLITSTSIWPT